MQSSGELMPSNHHAGEDWWESLGQKDQTSQSLGKSTLNTRWKYWCWIWNSSILVIWCEQLTQWKSPWCWERLRAEEEGIRRWDGWMPSPMQWTWTWANFGRWWVTEKTGVLQRVAKNLWGHKESNKWTTEQQQNNELCRASFHMFVGHLYVFLIEMSV